MYNYYLQSEALVRQNDTTFLALCQNDPQALFS